MTLIIIAYLQTPHFDSQKTQEATRKSNPDDQKDQIFDDSCQLSRTQKVGKNDQNALESPKNPEIGPEAQKLFLVV